MQVEKAELNWYKHTYTNTNMSYIVAVSCCVCESVVLALDETVPLDRDMETLGITPLFRTTTCIQCTKKILSVGGYTIAYNVVVGVMLAINSPSYKKVAKLFNANPRINSEYHHVIEPLHLVSESLGEKRTFIIMIDDIDIPTQPYESGFF